jgi:hypothetical protein
MTRQRPVRHELAVEQGYGVGRDALVFRVDLGTSAMVDLRIAIELPMRASDPG